MESTSIHNNKNHIFQEIPEETQINVFRNLDSQTLCLVAKVNTLWNRLSQDKVLWRPLIKKDFGIQLSSKSEDSKKAYRMLFQGEINSKTIETDNPIVDIKILNKKLIVAFNNGTINLYDLNGNYIKNIADDNSVMRLVSFQSNESKIVILRGFPNTQELLIWDSSNLKTLDFSHLSNISCFQMNNDFIFIGLTTGEIIKMDFNGSIQKTLTHSSPIASMKTVGNRLLSASSDRFVKVWENDEWIASQENSTIEAFSVHRDTLIILENAINPHATLKGAIAFFNVKTDEKKSRVHLGATKIKVFDQFLISYSPCSVKIWISETGECIATLKKEIDAFALTVLGKRIYTLCSQKFLIWDLEGNLLKEIPLDSVKNIINVELYKQAFYITHDDTQLTIVNLF